jgi:hypothetical protein
MRWGSATARARDAARQRPCLLAVGLLLRAREHGVRGALAGEEAVGTLLGRAEADIGLRAEGVAEPAARAAAPNGARASAALGEAPAPDALRPRTLGLSSAVGGRVRALATHRDFIGLEVDEVILLVEDVDVVPARARVYSRLQGEQGTWCGEAVT